jgi:hypothetical protein
VFNDTIASKWKEEALSAEELKLSPACLDWVIEELRYKAGIFQETGAVSVYNGDVVKSDTVITDALKEALKAAVVPLENVPEVHRDYHPGSDRKVIDLVHPSLFSLIYGRSRALPDRLVGLEDCLGNTGLGQTIPIPPEDIMARRIFNPWTPPRTSYSSKFQWLPCEVEMTGSEETGSEETAK